MATYKVLVDNFAEAKMGATVNESELAHLNLPALVSAGVLEPQDNKKTVKTTEGE